MIVTIFIIFKSVFAACTLKNGVELDASKFVCRRLNKALNGIKSYTDEQKQYRCEELGTIENGHIYCSSENSVGSVCLAFCSAGYKLSGTARKYCLYEEFASEPIKWNSDRGTLCLRTQLDSSCLYNNGGCSHKCIDRGFGDIECTCPCGSFLDANGKTCKAADDCPLDITVAIDAREKVCDDNRFTGVVSRTLKGIFGVLDENLPVNSFKIIYLREGLANVNVEISESDEYLSTLGSLFSTPNFCTSSTSTDLPLSSFNEIHSSVFLWLLRNPLTGITYESPLPDKIFVLTSKWVNDRLDSSICGGGGCIDENEDLIMNIWRMSFTRIASLFDRKSCFNRQQSTKFTCNSNSMTLEVPICHLNGLSADDITINSEKCPSVVSESQNGTYMRWDIGFTDCGIVPKERGALVEYKAVLRTFISEDTLIKPVMPHLNLEVKCDQLIETEFEVTDEFHAIDELYFNAEVSVCELIRSYLLIKGRNIYANNANGALCGQGLHYRSNRALCQPSNLRPDFG